MTPARADQGRWIRRLRESAGGAVRLVCFPHAGGSAGGFQWLADLLAPEVDVAGVQYPGRQDHYREPCRESVGALAEAAVRELESGGWLDRPYALLGHSMGALVAYEAALTLERRVPPGPLRLIASARRAPSRHRPGDVYTHDDDGLAREPRTVVGTNEQLLHPDIRALAFPPTRADYKAIETYAAAPGLRLACPVTVLVGAEDPHTAVPEAAAWREHTAAGFELRVFPGGHFYLDRCRVQAAEAILGAVLDREAAHH